MLLRERYINNFKVIEDDKQGILRVYLKYAADDVPVITGLAPREHARPPRVRRRRTGSRGDGRPRDASILSTSRGS